MKWGANMVHCPVGLKSTDMKRIHLSSESD